MAFAQVTRALAEVRVAARVPIAQVCAVAEFEEGVHGVPNSRRRGSLDRSQARRDDFVCAGRFRAAGVLAGSALNYEGR